MQYQCIRNCYWRNYGWRAGDVVSVSENEEKPPRHFIPLEEAKAAEQEIRSEWEALTVKQILAECKERFGVDLNKNQPKPVLLDTVLLLVKDQKRIDEGQPSQMQAGLKKSPDTVVKKRLTAVEADDKSPKEKPKDQKKDDLKNAFALVTPAGDDK